MGCCSSSEESADKDVDESLDRAAHTTDALLQNEHGSGVRPSSVDRNNSAASIGTNGNYASTTSHPAELDITKSARKRRRQNERCQLLLNRHTVEGNNNNAATAPSRTVSHARSIVGNENDIRNLVKAPAFADIDDWLSIHTVDFYNDLSLLCGTVLEFCEKNGIEDSSGEKGGQTKGGCHVMTAGPKYKYLWKDDGDFNSPMDMSASQYINVGLEWIDAQLDDSELFPSEGQPYSNNFQQTVRQIFKIFFRIYAHLYHSHFNDFVRLEVESHLNDSFRHFIFFVKEFNLLHAHELPPLQQLISFLEQQVEAQEREARQQVCLFDCCIVAM